MNENIRQFIVQLLLEKGSIPEGLSIDDYRYLDTGHIDSLSFIKFIFRVEEQFGIRFGASDISGSEIRTIGGLIRIIQSNIATP